jgi:hypothetical protein
MEKLKDSGSAMGSGAASLVRIDRAEGFEHVVVQAFISQEFFVSTHLYYFAILQCQDSISARNRG